MGWGKDNPPGGPVVANREGASRPVEAVEPWHGKTVDSTPTMRTMTYDAMYDPRRDVANRLIGTALGHWPGEVTDGVNTTVHCSCGQWWTTGPGEDAQRVRAAWGAHYAQLVMA